MSDITTPPVAPVPPSATPAEPAAPVAPETPAAPAAPATPAAGSDGKRVIPEAYKLELPKDSLLNPAKLAEVAEFAKANKFTNEEAQKVLERESATIAAYVDEAKKQAEEAWNKTMEDWINELKDDKEYGGDNFGKNAELSKRVVDRFADDQFKKDLIETGYGNHPGFNRFMAKLGKAMSEDQFVTAGAPPASKERKSTAEVLFGNPPKK